MRRLALLAVVFAAVAASTASPAAASTTMTHYEFDVDFSGPADYCAFPLTTSFHEHHFGSVQFKDLPEGIAPDGPFAAPYQVWGQHFIDFRETVTNPANGLTLDIKGTVRLTRRDFDMSGVTIDPDGKWNGFFTATDTEAASIVATAPATGTVILIAGLVRSSHTSIFVDDVRVGRIDIPFFSSGPFQDDLCAYLGGG